MDNCKINSHKHAHNHDISEIKGRNLIIAVLLNFTITAAELIGGIISGSLSLISDSVHNFSDGVSIIITYMAIKISGKDNDIKRTFGYKRATILAALINSSVLFIISLFLLKEAYIKFIEPQTINGGVVIWVALLGLLANSAGVFLLHKGARGDMNLRSSYLHLLSDALSSTGVVAGGILIYFYNIYWIDPLLTVFIGLYVMKESYEIIRKSLHLLMEGVPENLDVRSIAEKLQEMETVENVHHVHVWGLDEDSINFEAHVNIKDMLVSETKPLLEKIKHELHHHGINHVTIQFEYECCKGVELINNCKSTA